MAESREYDRLVRELEAVGFEYIGKQNHPKYRHPVTGRIYVHSGTRVPGRGRTIANARAVVRRLVEEHKQWRAS